MRHTQTTADRLRVLASSIDNKTAPSCKRCLARNKCDEFGCAIMRNAADELESSENSVLILTGSLRISADALEKAQRDLEDAKKVICRRCGRSENSSGPLCEGCRWRAE